VGASANVVQPLQCRAIILGSLERKYFVGYESTRNHLSFIRIRISVTVRIAHGPPNGGCSSRLVGDLPDSGAGLGQDDHTQHVILEHHSSKAVIAPVHVFAQFHVLRISGKPFAAQYLSSQLSVRSIDNVDADGARSTSPTILEQLFQVVT